MTTDNKNSSGKWYAEIMMSDSGVMPIESTQNYSDGKHIQCPVIEERVAMTGDFLRFKNPIRIHMELDHGDILIETSTPVTEEDITKIVDALRNYDKDLRG